MASTSSCAGNRRSERRRLAAAAAAFLLLALAGMSARADDAGDTQCLLRQGQLQLALDGLKAAHAAAAAGRARARAAAALGRAQLRLQQPADAEGHLAQAAAEAALPGPERAAVLLDLGQARAARGQAQQADADWRAAAAAAPDDAETQLAAELNRVHLLPPAERLPRLDAALQRLGALAPARQARLAVHAGAQAREADATGQALALQAFDQGRRLALATQQPRLAAEAYDGLAALYERSGRADEALALVERGLEQARAADATDWLYTLEGRAGRLAQRLGRDDLALQAYGRAVRHVEAVRSDIPVRYVDGRSSFRETLEPLYLGLADQLLRRAAQVPEPERSTLLLQARDSVELIKQTELEDYLRDRCSVESAARTGAARRPPEGTAIHTPIVLPDRLELLLETAQGIERRSVPLPGERLRDMVQAYVSALRSGSALRARSEALYRALVAPLERTLAEQKIHTLVTVPDGVLRLLPLGSLHDGRGWLLQRLAVATVPSLGLAPAPRAQAPALSAGRPLLAGMSEPGPVVGKLSLSVIDTVLEAGPEAARQPRRSAGADGPADPALQRELRQALALPGVKDEIADIARVLPSTVLLDGQFTLDALQRALRTQRPPVVHIASHGVFGDSAESTFIMTYDELLTLDALQALLRDGRGRLPIEVLTLSACQTAEGDDRAPLGMSGAALKARARTALGTLWPVSDEAAQQVMSGFYRRLATGGMGRAEALRQAQLELLQQPRRQHPMFWAPFILIGDWQ
ncbi:MAG: CHAT domain-containing protein [Rubrivivax sp.]